ncbi:MAG: hypothetical protein HXK22_04885 [Alloprevotella tannerae]|nr:hypothetical protein [Alloprevotella tannerae]
MITPITLEELQRRNGWNEIMPLLSGNDLFFQGKKLVYPGDWEYIKDKVCMYEGTNMDDEKKFIVSIPPEPWSCNILNAKVVILSLNPGYVPQLNKELACMFRAKQAENIMADKRAILEMCPRRESLPTKILGDWYWKRSLAHIGKDVYPESPERITDDIACIQSCAYASMTKISTGKGLMPSQEFTREVLRYIITNNPGTKFLLFRAESEWERIAGEELWGYLKESNRLIKSKNYRTQFVTPANIGEENYSIIKELILGNH